MTSKVEKSIEVEAPLQRVYNQWTQFEQFPQFMGGVEEVKQLNDTTLHWTAKIAGVKREWDAAILEQVPDRKVAWAATTGTTNAGSVYFESLGTHRTGVRLVLEYDPEGFVEKVGDRLNIVSRQAQNDLEKFKKFIESSDSETGAWRGTVNVTTPRTGLAPERAAQPKRMPTPPGRRVRRERAHPPQWPTRQVSRAAVPGPRRATRPMTRRSGPPESHVVATVRPVSGGLGRPRAPAGEDMTGDG